MPLKMKELIQATGESKSTILYYLKEGLLPEPKKPKPNVALYDDSSINRIKLIKYLQKNFSYSIAQIKEIFQNNNFAFDNSFDNLIEAIKALKLYNKEHFSKEEFLKKAQINRQDFEEFVSRGYIVPNTLGSSELEIVSILKRAKEMGLDFALLDSYVHYAKELAKLENDIGSKLLEDDSISHNSRYELLFDLILKLKPYIFNSYTVNEHKERINNG